MCLLFLIAISKKALNQILNPKELGIVNSCDKFQLKHHYICCQTNKCSCTKSHIPCTVFCSCGIDELCLNPKKMDEEEDTDDTNTEDEDM